MDLLEGVSSGEGGSGGDAKNFSANYIDLNSSHYLFSHDSNASLYPFDYDDDNSPEGHNNNYNNYNNNNNNSASFFSIHGGAEGGGGGGGFLEYINTTLIPDASLTTLLTPANNTINSAFTTSSSYPEYERFMDESRHWVQKVFVPLVMCVGVVGNSVSMVVLTRRKMRSSTNNYLTALAISDLLYLVFVFSLSLQHHPDIKHPRHWFYWQYFRYALWLTDASSSTSIWLTVTFTIERYIAISHPMKGKMLCTVSRAKKVVAVVYFLCFALTATTPHEWVVVKKHRPDTQEPYLNIEFSKLGQDSTYRHTYYWFTAVTFILLPLCLLAVFNFFLMQAVRMSKLTRRKMTLVSERDHYSQKQEHKITVMLIAVVILALVCQMPTAVLLLYSTVYEPPPRTKEFAVMRGLGNIFNLLNAINAAANFILYCCFSDRYRRTFLVTFVPCMYHQQQPFAHSFIVSINDTTVGGRGGLSGAAGGRSTDSLSVRSVSRRVSKASSTPSPSPLANRGGPTSSLRSAGSFRENGVGVAALNAKVNLHYGLGRSSNLLTPPDPHSHTHTNTPTSTPTSNNKSSSQSQSKSQPQSQSPTNTLAENTHHSPLTRSKHNSGGRTGIEWSPERTSTPIGNHYQGVTHVDLEECPRSPDNNKTQQLEVETEAAAEHVNMAGAKLGRDVTTGDEEVILATLDCSILNSCSNHPLELKFIDEESFDTCRSSPTSNTRIDVEFERDGDATVVRPDEEEGDRQGGLATRDTIVSFLPLTPDAAQGSIIHSPD